MSLEYKVVERADPTKRDAPNKYHAQIIRTKRRGIRSLADKISLGTSLTPVEIIAVTESLIQFIPRLILDGETIVLGNFGSFKASLSSAGSDTPEEVNNENIRNIRILFSPSVVLKQKFAEATLKKTNKS